MGSLPSENAEFIRSHSGPRDCSRTAPIFFGLRMTDLADIQAQHEAARLEFEMQEYRAAARQLEEANRTVMEAWGDYIDPKERFYDDPYFPNGNYSQGSYYESRVDDRTRGKFRPLFENEVDLSVIRAASNRVVWFDEIGTGALKALKAYIYQDGIAYRATPLDDTKIPEGDKEAIQDAINRILEVNQYTNYLDREYHDRARVDGEYFLRLDWRDGEVIWSEEEPEHVREPALASQRDLEDWLGIGFELESDWRFGIHTPMKRPHEPMGYHLVYDMEGNDWEYVPAENMVHFKLNVTRRTKRGIPDFFCILKDLERDAKLVENTALGAALQAAIAWIKEYPTEVKTGSITSAVAGANSTYKRRVQTESGAQDRHVQKLPPGTILNVKGAAYKPGPMGSERNPNFILVSQHLRRTVGVRFQMPEFMISGDASNGNYSSTSVAADAFVKAREDDQRLFSNPIIEALWKSLKILQDRGQLSLSKPIKELRSLVKIEADGKDPSTKSPLEKREALAIEVQNGWTSDETAATELGRNYQDEKSKGAERQANPNVQAANGGGGVDDKMGAGAAAGTEQRIGESLSRITWEGYP